MSRLLPAFLMLALLAGACQPSAKEAAEKDKKVTAFASKVRSSLKQNNPKAISDNVQMLHTLKRIEEQAGGLNELQRKQVMRDMYAFFDQLLSHFSVFAKQDDVEMTAMNKLSDGYTATFAVTNLYGISFFDLYLKEDNGHVYITDFYSYHLGLLFSDAVVKDQVLKLNDKDAYQDAQRGMIESVRRLQDGKPDEAMALFAQMPEEYASQPLILAVKLEMAMGISDSLFQVTFEEFRNSNPEDKKFQATLELTRAVAAGDSSMVAHAEKLEQLTGPSKLLHSFIESFSWKWE